MSGCSAEAAADPESYWRREAAIIDWIRPFDRAADWSFAKEDFHIRWFQGGQLNLSSNCLDRHLAERGDTAAIIWEGDDPTESRTLSYAELHAETCRFANVLKAHGVVKGDRVTLYMPMIPEAAVAMLACARIGAIHSIVFGGFSPEALAGRIVDCESRVVITADEGRRGGKAVPLKANVDAAIAHATGVEQVIVIRHTGGDVTMQAGRDVWYEEACATVSEDCPPAVIDAEDPLFILYTSGSTGKPKGVMHTTGGYAVWAAWTHRHVFDYRPGPDLLVRGRYRLGHRAQLCRLRAAHERGPRPSCSKACPTGPITAASGRSSTSIRSRFSMQHPPRCARSCAKATIM